MSPSVMGSRVGEARLRAVRAARPSKAKAAILSPGGPPSFRVFRFLATSLEQAQLFGVSRQLHLSDAVHLRQELRDLGHVVLDQLAPPGLV